MTTVTKAEIRNSLTACGLRAGDTVLVHSSLKACGWIDGGAEAVIEAFSEILGDHGTLVMPTLSQKDFPNAYRDWHIDRPSDVGLITETFRRQDGVCRSDQPTHSVAARGELAEWLTRDHGLFGKRIGKYGDTPFAVCSPWQKMADMNAKILFFGVDLHANTMKHLLEYQIVSDLLDNAPTTADRDTLVSALRLYGSPKEANLIWVHANTEKTQDALQKAGLFRQSPCGEGLLTCMRAGDTNRYARSLYLADPEKWYPSEVCAWFEKAFSICGRLV